MMAEYRVQAQSSTCEGPYSKANYQVFSVVDDTGANAINYKKFEIEDAENIADALNLAFQRGLDSAAF